jgi:hypothetical protein
MSTDRDALELECQLRLIDLCNERMGQDSLGDPIDLFVDGFWAGVRASAKPRTAEVLRQTIEQRRRAHALTK